MERLLRKVFYRFMMVLAWIFGWPILLTLEIRERLFQKTIRGKDEDT